MIPFLRENSFIFGGGNLHTVVPRPGTSTSSNCGWMVHQEPGGKSVRVDLHQTSAAADVSCKGPLNDLEKYQCGPHVVLYIYILY